MSTSTLGSSKSLNGKTIGIAVGAAVIVLGLIGWTAGWFGGTAPVDSPPPAGTATEQSTAPAAPQPPAASTQQGTSGTATTP